MKVLILGKGAREHAFAKSFSKNDLLEEVYVCPGNAGMKITPKVKTFAKDDINSVTSFCKEQGIENIFIGAENYLAEGYKDQLSGAGFHVVGPTKEAARLESSKIYCKYYLNKAGIPCAESDHYDDFEELKSNCEYLIEDKPLVLKWDHLAGGKGVFVCHNKEDLNKAYKSIAKLPGEFSLVLEDFIEGEEISAFTYVKNGKVYYFGSACDYKRRTSDPASPNTGGMGAFSPNNKMPEAEIKNITMDYSNRLLKVLNEDQTEYEGFLFWGFMINRSKPYVLEINCRFGDPEAQAILPRIENELFSFFFLKQEEIRFSKDTAIHLVKVDPEYPYRNSINEEIIIKADDDIEVFFAGVKEDACKLYSQGGRILGITTLSSNLSEARKKIYQKLDCIRFKGEDYREDIGC